MNEQEIIKNELETVDNVIELYPEASNGNVGKIVGGIAVVAAVGALGYQVYRIVKAKRAKKHQESETDNVKVAESDFLETEETEE